MPTVWQRALTGAGGPEPFSGDVPPWAGRGGGPGGGPGGRPRVGV